MAAVAGDRAIFTVAWDGVVGAIELWAMEIFERYVEIIRIWCIIV